MTKEEETYREFIIPQMILELKSKFNPQENKLLPTFLENLGFENLEDYIFGLFFTKDGKFAASDYNSSVFDSLMNSKAKTFAELKVEKDLTKRIVTLLHGWHAKFLAENNATKEYLPGIEIDMKILERENNFHSQIDEFKKMNENAIELFKLHERKKKDELAREKKTSKNTKKKTDVGQVENYFQWMKFDDKRNKLCDLLKQKALVNSDYRTFCSIVVIDEGTDSFEKIKWLLKPLNMRQITHLFVRLIEGGYINSGHKRKIGRIIANRFCDADGNSIDATTLQKSYSNFKTFGKDGSKSIADIEEIILELGK